MNQEHEEGYVSTELTLALEYSRNPEEDLTSFGNSFMAENRIPVQDSAHNIPSAAKIFAMKHHTPAEEKMEKISGVSTKLMLNDPFKIKKNLPGSDLGNLYRLLVNTKLVKNYVLPFLSPHVVDHIEGKAGLRVQVWDQDTDSMHQLVFKRWETSKSYVLIGEWNQDFVHRRALKAGDEIGLYWDPCDTRFTFSVLRRAPRN